MNLNLTFFKMLFSAYLGHALKTWKPMDGDATVITCNDYIPFNFDSQPICLSMQEMNAENQCNIILPSSIQIHFDTFSINDDAASLTVFQGNDERYSDSWKLTTLSPGTSPIFYQKNVELTVSTIDPKAVICFRIENIFPLKKSIYRHLRFLRT